MAFSRLRRALGRAALRDRDYRFLFEPAPVDEAVSIDCETTGLNRRKDDIVAVAAIKIRGRRILASERIEIVVRPQTRMNPEAIKTHRLREADVAGGRAIAEALPELLRFIGGRPLVGYYLDFDVAMLDKHVRRLIGVALPNPRIEVSALYYRLKYGDAPPGVQVDLSFSNLIADLDLPMLDRHDAYSDALMTAMIFLALSERMRRGARIARRGGGNAHHFSVS
jgi:DNA polymerase-3 subunit epsilon